MAIPIQNIYYLLCYTWNKLDEDEIIKVDSGDETELINLFARVLINGTSHLFKRGLDRDYIEKQEQIVGLKGKLNTSLTIKKNLFPRGQTICTFDEFSYNILHNQILKSTIRYLLKTENLDKKLKSNLLTLFRKFHNVEEIILYPKIFKKVKLHRNNKYYGLLLHICQIIIENLLPNESSGNFYFQDFIRNEKKMAYLFQNFVRNFYNHEFPELTTKAEDIKWDIEASVDTLALMPKMQTDITVLSPNKKLIIDTKFYKEALRTNFQAQKFHEGNLYQLYAYLKNVESKNELSQSCNGLLLYPTTTKLLNHQVQIDNHTLFFKTINLNQHWSSIQEDLKTILLDCLK